MSFSVSMASRQAMGPAKLSKGLLVLTTFVLPSVAQISGWVSNQISATICTWMQPRAALIRDTVYIDGGSLYWSPRMKDGNLFRAPEPEANFDGLVLTFNLSEPIKKDTNTSGLLVKNILRKSEANVQIPYFVDGAMLYNDAEAFLYGGVQAGLNDADDAPRSNQVWVYQAYNVGPEKPLWKAGFDSTNTGPEVNRYVAYGGAASAPSENKAWYFSGLTSRTMGQIDYNVANASNAAHVPSNRLITVDMSTQNNETWSNKTIKSDVKPRANPELVWVPVGKQGILVVLGGVTYPQWAGTKERLLSDDAEASKKESPEFMKIIDIYDVASGNWYKQSTVGGPGALTRGCAVVAVSSDHTSYNIYYYGGFNGIDALESFNDEVWVLSMPSFTWHKVNEGKRIHARAGHKCFKPYADQMMAFGGYTPQSGTDCLDGGPIVMFNLSSGEWMDEYDPRKFSNYAVPSKVYSKIGGDGTGGATMVTPSPSGWGARGLAEIFGEPYNMKKITNYGPFNTSESAGRPSPTGDGGSGGGGGGGGLPSWVAPVLGVIIGLIVLVTALVLFCLWKRRGSSKNGSSGSSTEDAGKRIISWMRGHQHEKSSTLPSTEEASVNAEIAQYHTTGQRGMASGTATTTTTPGLEGPPNRYEVEDTQIEAIAELSDTSPPVELPDNPLSHSEILSKHSRQARGLRSPSTFSSPSSFSFTAGAEYTSTISRSSAAANSSAPLGVNRDTPPLGGSTPEPEASSRVISGVSGLSDAEAGHLRHVSETSIDANLASVTPPPAAAAAAGSLRNTARPGVGPRGDSNTLSDDMPISPPTAGDAPGEDYITARQAIVSPLRRSVFRESEEDMRRY